MIDYTEIKSAKTEIQNQERELTLCQLDYEIKVREYRIQSVNKVLDFIRAEYSAKREVDIDVLLCHCQNKLLGNIDGIEISLRSKTE